MAEPYLGEIRFFGGSFAPVGWALCDGSILNIAENDALFALIGAAYGGDGQTTFALPDLRGRVGIHKGQASGSKTSYPLGGKGGTETVTLTTSQLPSHTHVVQANNNGGETNDPTNAFWAGSTVNQYAKTPPNTQMNPQVVTSSGRSQPHDNMMPTLTVSYIIALQGVFPTQG